MVQIDISMPQSCDDCPFLLVDYKTNVPECDLMEDLPNSPEYDWNTPMGQKDKNCPLREVPKGKWLEREVHETEEFDDIGEFQSAKCSVCGRYHTTPYLYYFQHYNYCPGCGAEMEDT